MPRVRTSRAEGSRLSSGFLAVGVPNAGATNAGAPTSAVLSGPGRPSADTHRVRFTEETAMLFRRAISIAVLLASVATAQAFDDAKYPDFFGVWRRVNFRVAGQPSFDQTKPWGRGQQAPLTPEYQAIHKRASPTRPTAARATGSPA